MKNKKRRKELFPLYLLWGTQTFSALGSAMTSYALVIWSYAQTGQALSTALLMVCSYAPYVLMSVFAGALSDRWDKRRTMIVCDLLAVFSTGLIGLLLAAGQLQIWHLYLLNAFSGLMGTVQQPASEVAVTLLTPRDFYQKISALRSFSGSLNSPAGHDRRGKAAVAEKRGRGSYLSAGKPRNFAHDPVSGGH